MNDERIEANPAKETKKKDIKASTPHPPYTDTTTNHSNKHATPLNQHQ